MSDFGSVISIEKSKGEKFSDDDRSLIINELTAIVTNGNYTDATETALKPPKLITDSPTKISFMLTEYWFGGEDDEVLFNFAKQEEAYLTEELSSSLAEKLGASFKVNSDFITW